MFNDDDVRLGLTKMYDYSPVDGFVEISEGLGEMMTSLANEPSVGLFYVQQHIHKAVPNIVNLRNNIVLKSREIGLHTEDSEDSITMVRLMADCGFPIVDDMIKDVAKCLAIMSSKQPKRGLISSRSFSGFKAGRTGPWGRSCWRGNVDDLEKSTGLLLPVSKLETGNGSANAEQSVGEELPVSSFGNDDDNVLVDNLLSNPSGFDGLKGDKEARFEEWLGGSE